MQSREELKYQITRYMVTISNGREKMEIGLSSRTTKQALLMAVMNADQATKDRLLAWLDDAGVPETHCWTYSKKGGLDLGGNVRVFFGATEREIADRIAA